VEKPTDKFNIALTIPVSLGELIDRISILELKHALITDGERHEHVRYELELLTEVLERQGLNLSDPRWDALRQVNAQLWDMENRIRDLDRRGCWNREFIEVARAIHNLNDNRHSLKREISLRHATGLVEEKHYA
jgi:hypothetical protein